MITQKWRKWANAFKWRLHALYIASRHPGVPRPAKAFIALVVAYALSPIDLIPEFIPVLGLLDDLVLLPLGIWLAVRLIPEPVWEECQALARARAERLPESRRAIFVIVALWLLILALSLWWITRYFDS